MQRLNAAALIARGCDYRATKLIRCVLEDERIEATGYCISRCEYRNCLFCCRRYWKRFRHKYNQKIDKVMCESYHLSLLTLTIRNTDRLSPTLYKWLAENLKKLLRRYPFKGQLIGAVARIETDFNDNSQDFHPHIHAIIITKQYIPQKAIADAWRDLTQPNVYVPSDIPGRASNPCFVWIKEIEQKAISRVVRYLFKFRPIADAEAFAEYDCAVVGVRLVQSYGVLFERKRKAQRC